MYYISYYFCRIIQLGFFFSASRVVIKRKWRWVRYGLHNETWGFFYWHTYFWDVSRCSCDLTWITLENIGGKGYFILPSLSLFPTHTHNLWTVLSKCWKLFRLHRESRFSLQIEALESKSKSKLIIQIPLLFALLARSHSLTWQWGVLLLSGDFCVSIACLIKPVLAREATKLCLFYSRSTESYLQLEVTCSPLPWTV